MENKEDTKEIVARILARDKNALLKFYRTYAPQIRRHIAHKIHDPSDVEEVLQDTLYAFLESIRDFTYAASIRTYVFSICRHKIADYYRKREIKHAVFSRIPQLEALIMPLVSSEEKLDAELMSKNVVQTLGRLMPAYKDVLSLRYIDGMAVSDVAQKLALTVKSAECKLFRAKKAFVKAFIAT